jgi:hypothetical protein
MLYAGSVWPYVAAIVGAIVLVLGVGRRLATRTKRAPSAIDKGQLSDAWLAEQRGNREH